MDYQRDEHRVHLVVYHLIWVPKRRRPVLVGRVAKDCERVVREVCAENRWEVLRLAVMPDHVHLFVRVSPDVAVSEVARRVKGRTSHDLRRDHRQLLRLPSLWTRSYFCSTAGNVSGATIDRYIAEQARL